MYAPIVFALGPEANHFMTVSNAANFRWRDGGMGDLIPLLGDGLLTTDGAYHRRARQIMLPAFHREQIAAATDTMTEEVVRALADWRPGAPRSLQLDASRWRCGSRCARCSASIPIAACATPTWPRSSSALGFWGEDYAVQMLRGPGSPWRRMQRSRGGSTR